MNSWFWSR